MTDNEFYQQSRLAALNAAVAIIANKLPLTIDYDTINNPHYSAIRYKQPPKVLDIETLNRIMEASGNVYTEAPKEVTPADVVVKEANKIFNWLINSDAQTEKG